MLTGTSVVESAVVEGIRDTGSGRELLRSVDASMVVADTCRLESVRLVADVGSELDVSPGSGILVDESDID